MKKILIIEPREHFYNDLERCLMLLDEDELGFETSLSSDVSVIYNLSKDALDEIVIAAGVMNSADWNIDIPVRSYCKTEDDVKLSHSKGIACFGIINKAKELLLAIKEGKTLEVFKTQEIKPVSQPETTPGLLQEEKIENEETEDKTPIQEIEQEVIKDIQKVEPTLAQTPVSEPLYTTQKTNEDISGVAALRQAATERKNDNLLRSRLSAQIEEEIKRDLKAEKKPAKCITIYSAKGGVGKTTISCELANFLSLSQKSGHERYKVCLVDFNIDFGDALLTLGFDIDGANMLNWCEDIQLRIESGEKIEDIKYTQPRIINWLQHDERSGLYALLAPRTNADSMFIDDNQVELMLNALINDCDFDFVICDTGNNTRDTSFISIITADSVFLVVDQTTNACNCNNSFLGTVDRIKNKINLDTSKFKLIINRVRPARTVGISVSEVEENFSNNKSIIKVPCVAKIKESTDVVLATNLGQPLTYNPNHEFTRAISDIARNIIDKQPELIVKTQKENLLKKLFKKRG